MKLQIKFQKILFLASLIIAGISIVYGLSFCTESIAYANKYVSNNSYSIKSGLRDNPINADALYQFVIGKGAYAGGGQWEDGWLGFNNLIILLCIALIVIVALQYVFSSNNRRNYYITNYISVGVLVVYAIVVAAIGLWGVSTAHTLFSDINFEYWAQLNGQVEGFTKVAGFDYYTESCTVFYLGYIVFGLILLDAVLLVLNTVWKVLLMRGEKALLNGNKTVSVSDNLVKEGA